MDALNRSFTVLHKNLYYYFSFYIPLLLHITIIIIAVQFSPCLSYTRYYSYYELFDILL